MRSNPYAYKTIRIPKSSALMWIAKSYLSAPSRFSVLSSVRPKAGSLASHAWISTGSLTGDHQRYTTVDRLERMMQITSSRSSVPLDRLRLLLQSFSKLFEEHFKHGDVYIGRMYHSLSIKLGVETHLHRNLITLYGRELNLHRESVMKVLEIIPRGSFYKSLNPMVHSFAYVCQQEAFAAFAMIVKLGHPDESSVSALLLALKTRNLAENKFWKVEKAGESVLKLMRHYNIPFVPRLVGGVVEMYSASGLMKYAYETLLAMPKIDDIAITSFFNGCIKYEDFASASKLVHHLEKQEVVYTLNIAIVRKLTYLGTGVKFGKNVRISKKEVGVSMAVG